MRVLAVLLIASCVLVAGCMDPGPAPEVEVPPTITPPPVSDTAATTEEMVAVVMKAFEYANVHGKEAAIAEFNNQAGRFVEGELYIFAYDLEGTTLALPFQPEIIGTNRWNITDAYGSAFIQEIIGAAESGGGFVRYYYPDPAENFTVRPKISYVMMVDGEYVIGSGIYGADEDDPLIRVGGDPVVREEMKAFVEDAVAYAREHGKADALAEFNDPDGRFVSGERYIYAFDYQGMTLALPHQPQLIGTDLSDLQDPFGVNYTRVEIYLSGQGGGYLFYHYPNPAHDMALEPKMSYVAPVDETLWLGAGIYLSDVPHPTSIADLAAFVENAAAYAASVGEHAALAEFQQKEGQFSQGNLYIYAYDYDRTLLAHPYEAHVVGTDRSNWTDARGVPVIRIGAYTASRGGGYLAYLYPAPEGGVIDEKALDSYQPKIGYVYPVDEYWWIGSGIYFYDMVPMGAGRPEVISRMIGLVEDAAEYGQKQGAAAAFAEISDTSGRFVDAEGHYIYAYDYNGTLLAHPYLPEKIGTSLIDHTDPFGMENLRAMCDTAKDGGGYIVFIWPNPERGNQDELKIGYVLPVDEEWWVGSGVYLSEITGEDSPSLST